MERPAFGDRDGLAALAELGSLSATELALECRIEPPAARRWLLDAQSRHLVHSDGAGGGWTVTERGRIAARSRQHHATDQWAPLPQQVPRQKPGFGGAGSCDKCFGRHFGTPRGS
jgi:hypothetical protein